VQALQRALSRAAKASAERRFHALRDTVFRENILTRAWQACFERMDDQLLLGVLRRRISDRRLQLIREWLTAGVLDRGGISPTEQGAPQGGVLSPLLANVVLDQLDRVPEERCRSLVEWVRCADDFVLL
jgi:retron-type reverse transcriptase